MKVADSALYTVTRSSGGHVIILYFLCPVIVVLPEEGPRTEMLPFIDDS